MDQRPIDTLPTDAVWATIDAERADLAGLLDDLSPDEWAHPSLCAGWRVRDVVAHLALAQTGPGRATLDLVRARGSLPRMIHDSAVRHAVAPPEQLTAEIRAMVGSRRRAPGVTPMEPLLDVLVHGQDVAVPLGRERHMPVAAAVPAATRVWTMPWPMSTTFPRVRGVRLVATDADWSAGEGDIVEAPIEALLLVLTGRTAAVRDRLAGPGVARLR
ncbi:maleylpyruvate isomerase family mycothiol-dependent enzyme [Blastococcus sp. TML/M2B]|uniref:maleylpyruvate isomerase family mycothiol-dependent enzyme n=1 Tax=unclassified Blastococcus TaxID=2619396 RepID=UPI001909FBCE|nr:MULTISPECIES: maleylpyruvate isomerase family mycothiol-dependent enzyme [unclassified Blastococcus]MBN1092081.1 maleylpyruvate isomerase family mycothiol-dependent enzyme [Blastococcus sp. TML/M2B]MBN1097813.1 maleylpyruvate isomerase family mycothiol-dependent enzyme [Blastococcus sp. TML/C7B]